jgi:hypothetical protein
MLTSFPSLVEGKSEPTVWHVEWSELMFTTEDLIVKNIEKDLARQLVRGSI